LQDDGAANVMKWSESHAFLYKNIQDNVSSVKDNTLLSELLLSPEGNVFVNESEYVLNH